MDTVKGKPRTWFASVTSVRSSDRFSIDVRYKSHTLFVLNKLNALSDQIGWFLKRFFCCLHCFGTYFLLQNPTVVSKHTSVHQNWFSVDCFGILVPMVQSFKNEIFGLKIFYHVFLFMSSDHKMIYDDCSE